MRASQISIGHLNDLGIEVYGTKGTLRWRQEDPEVVTISLMGQPDRVYYRGAVTPGDGFLPKDVPADLMAEPTIPSGHPEAFHDAFRTAASLLRSRRSAIPAGKPFANDGSKYATVEDGWTGMAFLQTCLDSNSNKGAWTPMPKLS